MVELLQSLNQVLTFPVFGLALLGTVIGIIIGALPGLTAVMAVVIMLPLTYTMTPQEAFALLLPTFSGAIFGGSLGAILLNIPGTGAAIMTTFDGYPMSCRGEAGQAIGLAVIFSFIGGIFSAIFLTFFSPIIAKLALRFGAHEFFAVAFFGLGVIAYISDSMVMGMISGTLGLLIATVGTDPQAAYPRFIFGQADLMSGLNFVPVMIGVFGLGEIFTLIEKGIKKSKITKQRISGLLPKPSLLLRMIPTTIRSTVVGIIIGAIPASGPTIASVVSYGLEKRLGKNRDEMGKGVPEGIVAAETGNNAACGASIVPMIALGIPGDATTAILIGALLLHGLTPGPMLFIDNVDVVHAIFILFFLGNVFFLIFGLVGIRFFVLMLRTPQRILFPLLLTFCVIGSYTVQNNPFDILVLIFFGILGYIMRKVNLPPAPLILGFILGPLVEDNLRRALILSNGNPLDLLTRPVSGTLIVLTILLLFSPYIFRITTGRRLKIKE